VFSDASANWFIAQVLAGLAALLLGRQLGRRSETASEIVLGLVALGSVLWALRRFAEDALIRLAPLDLLIYTEGTLIVPFIALLAGTFIGLGERNGRARLGWLLAVFAMTYLVSNGMWMLAPLAKPHDALTITTAHGVRQSRPDTCVAASLATALRAPDIGLRMSESEMASLADVRSGHGSTTLRALRGARAALAGTRIQPRLITCTAAEAVTLASRKRPALVTLRAGLRERHMVVLLGSDHAGQVTYFNPAEEIVSVGGRVWTMRPDAERAPFDEFARRFTGSAIVFLDSPMRGAGGGW